MYIISIFPNQKIQWLFFKNILLKNKLKEKEITKESSITLLDDIHSG